MIRTDTWIHKSRVAFIGCGRLAKACVDFLAEQADHVREIVGFELNPTRGRSFCDYARKRFPDVSVTMTPSTDSWREAVTKADIIFFCTTSVTPYCDSLESTADDCVVLHLSLRDLSPEAIESTINITDSIEHACSNKTSLALLAENRIDFNFIKCTITDLLLEPSLTDSFKNTRVTFSPFGLAVIDIYFACKVYEHYLASKSMARLSGKVSRMIRRYISSIYGRIND